MPNVSGLVLFSPNRTITSTSTLTPVSSVAVTLYNPVSQIGAANPGSTPRNFATATTIPVPIPKDPPTTPITTRLPADTNTIDSMTPNTFNLTVNSTDLLNQHFVDAPIV